MSKFGIDINDNEIKQIMAEHDENNDGAISRREFASVFENL